MPVQEKHVKCRLHYIFSRLIQRIRFRRLLHEEILQQPPLEHQNKAARTSYLKLSGQCARKRESIFGIKRERVKAFGREGIWGAGD